MNKTSHTDEPFDGDDGYNQSPSPLSNDLTTNMDLNGIVNRRILGDQDGAGATSSGVGLEHVPQQVELDIVSPEDAPRAEASKGLACWPVDRGQPIRGDLHGTNLAIAQPPPPPPPPPSDSPSSLSEQRGGQTAMRRLKNFLIKFCSFIGPGFMISVAYIDPGNYSTDIAAGASYRFRLLFIVLLSNIIAIFLQSLAIQLGTVSGLNLAEACRAFLPRWLNYLLYVFAEIAIIATDIAEVIGFAIALNLLIPQIPLVAGCAISILDVMVILFFYRPQGSMRSVRYFEIFVVLLVLAVVACFCVQMSLIRDTSVGKVFQGYLPSHHLIEQQALYQSCGILGATVMPHSLYLGSGIVQPRLRDFDERHGLLPPEVESSSIADVDIDKGHYIPSLSAIRHCLKVSTLELAISLFTFALFVNSAILIVAGAALYNNPDALSADIFDIHRLLSQSISSGAGTLFALALLFSGVSAGIICTIAGQMVSEGALNWKIRPWLRRLVTRSISITPSIIIAGAVGRDGLDAALNGTQVALSIVLPVVSAPLIYFTCRDKYMTVLAGQARWLSLKEICIRSTSHSANEEARQEESTTLSTTSLVRFTNSWYTAIFAILIWLFMVVMNVANLALLGKS